MPTVGTPTVNTGTGTISFAHDNGSGSNRVLLVKLSLYHGSALPSVSSVTYNGTGLTAITSVSQTFSGRYLFEAWYYLIGGTTGSNTVAASVSNVDVHTCLAVTCTGAHQTSPIGVSGTESGASGTPITTTLSGTSASTSVVFQGIAGRGNIGPYTTSNTELEDTNGANLDSYTQYASGAMSSITATPSGNNAHCSLAFELLEAAGSAKTFPASAALATATPAAVLGVSRAMPASATVATATPAAVLGVDRPMPASAALATATPDTVTVTLGTAAGATRQALYYARLRAS